MYSTLALKTNSKKSGRIIGTHQKLDKIAYKIVAKNLPEGIKFPTINQILLFEGMGGPDGLKRKSPGKDEPMHFIIPDKDDGVLIKMIEDHQYNMRAALKKGDLNENVRRMQIYLSRISGNYPSIPKIPVINGAFDESTENAVRTFQRIFSLTPDGIIGKATWYKIIYIYDSVTRLAELDSEGIGYENIPKQFKGALKQGDTGGSVVTVQYFLTLLSRFVDFLPDIAIDGIYGTATANAVSSFQRYKGLPITGETDERTWESLYSAYKGVVDYLDEENQLLDVPTQPYPGVVLKRGDVGPSVRIFKEYLAYIGRVFFEAQPLPVNNIFDLRTQNAVKEFQRIFELPESGQVDQTTWNTIADVYRTLRLGQQRLPGQYPGRELKEA
jgi:peptidoglycan hydrolase-like protein with peptidoglycan-binding domain